MVLGVESRDGGVRIVFQLIYDKDLIKRVFRQNKLVVGPFAPPPTDWGFPDGAAHFYSIHYIYYIYYVYDICIYAVYIHCIYTLYREIRILQQ